jgi:stage V sporulation protein G
MLTRISEINVVPIKPDNGLVGFASIVFDGSLYLGSIGIFTRPAGGYRLTYPMRNGLNVFHPINKPIADAIEKKVTEKFEQVLKGNRYEQQ